MVSMQSPVVLENSQACAVVLPQHGAGLASFDLRWRGNRLPVFRPLVGELRNERDLALFLLAPFSNRISHGGFEWNGRRYPLQTNVADEPFPLHGDAWQQAWTLTEQSSTHARLQLRSRQTPPLAYDAQIDWRLDGPSLHATLAMTHCGKDPMPYGGGFHPWFLRDPDVQLESAAQGWWSGNALHLPTRWNALADDDPRSFRTLRALPPEFVNTLYTGWNGQAKIVWPRRGVALEVRADAPLNRFIFYSPGADANFFCFEPVSHDVDAHNTASPTQAGLVVLKEGDCLRLSSRFSAMAE
ncbi:aldose 1-epimerase [Verminephrobacter aporrectodeae subsp. tuberculatae]|uniref:Aldose 1-epimerase n=2 Tax=Verminephrobacter TaxID=364316 RepID=A0ABT3KQK0_9BURK|nr:aldose 1-epimerase [Verminephrobacter aporrectodeae subsp. tuberculatae]MCW8177083.1 aldose 1-epimerase [Verminephrobacter aporrectodeae subsp. tuberculatae]MCW8204565.1 aldose 1-epimerase [Verminephrobacter aporrectodeae subsp. tuberculatae]